MAARYKDLITLKAVTDHDCGNYRVGEIDFSYRQADIDHQVRKYGADDMLLMLAHLTTVVCNTRNRLLTEEIDASTAGP